MTKELQASTSGGARGGARRAEKIFLEIAPPPHPLSQDLDDRLSPSPYLKVCILHCGATIGVGFREVSVRR